MGINQLAAAMNRELHAADPALVSNDDLLRGVLSGSGDCIKILDLEGRLQFMSEGGKRVMEVDDFAALKGCPWPDFWQGEGNTQAAAAVEAARAGRIARFQNAANTARGNPRHWDVQVSPIMDANGNISHLLSISRDITEEWRATEALRKFADHQKFLTEELTHRVKNTLATVGAIANQTFMGDVYKEARAAFGARIQTLSAAYNVLTESSWSNNDIGGIVEGALAPYRTGTGRFAISGFALDVTPSRALTLALAVNELATNAVKYGALSVPDGKVRISWGEQIANGARTMYFEWRETGGPAVVPPTRIGFGSRLVKSMLASDFGGSVEISYAPGGVVCRLEAPSK